MKEYPKKEKHYTTDLAKHKRDGKTLYPPLQQLSMTPSSWKDDRMPEMLWAVLLIGNLKREDTLNIFRNISNFVSKQTNCLYITHSEIAKWPKESRESFIQFLVDSNSESQKILSSLVLFPDIPGYEEWKKILKYPKDENDAANFLSKGIIATLDHQSQESTDCRWLKLLCLIEAGLISFSSKISGIHETLKGIYEYPNYGDLKRIRPFIRASEIGIQTQNGMQKSEWSKNFWDACLKSTYCSPVSRKEQRKDKINVSHNQISRIRHLLMLHYYKTDESTAIEPKHDSIFGLGFYALRLLDELVATNLSRGMIGRLALRSCVEVYITLSYLIKNDNAETWQKFRDYGIGQMKLSYLKNRDSKDKPSFIDEQFLKEMLNEDRWEEFSTIQISQWTNLDLRRMSDDAECKNIYDAYYDWTSSFSHGNWGAIREANFEICANPLHRLHLIPSTAVEPLPGVLEDVVRLTNLILSRINDQYPDFNCQILNETEPEKTSLWKQMYSKVRYRKMQKLFKFITGQKISKKK